MATSNKSSRKWIWLIVLLVLIGVVGYVFWSRLLREQPLHYESALDNFKYGSIGTESGGLAVPFWIWLVLPRMFPEYLPGPGGYTALGFAWEEGHELPIGLPKKTVGQPMVGINCAMCHTATVRENQYVKPTLYVGAPAHQFDTQGYFRFLFACVSDPRFNADNVLAAIAPNHDMGFIDKLLYRYIIIPQVKKGLLEFKQSMAWMDTRPDWGRGRIDPFNPAKFRYLGIPVDNTIGNSDMESVWNMRTRVDHHYVNHWDGLLHGTLQDVVLSSALGDSVLPKKLPLADLKRVEEFLLDAPVPRYPFKVDQALASQGGLIYQQNCALCHAVGGTRTGQVVPVTEVGTDRHRLDSWTKQAADNYNAFGASYPWKFNHFQKTNGYTNVLLDGIWLRAPYLHNGSVPTLTDLLEPVENRPKVFWNGYDVYDQAKVGFVTTGAEAERFGSKLDVTAPGNSNSGHLWGTTLTPEEKRALIEYMKTL
jgi:mono/diheme cytochrome c family protein